MNIEIAIYPAHRMHWEKITWVHKLGLAQLLGKNFYGMFSRTGALSQINWQSKSQTN